MQKLIFIPTPHPKESSISLLMRCATANGYENLKTFGTAWSLNLKSVKGNQWRGSAACKLLSEHELLSPQEQNLVEKTFLQKIRHGSHTLVDISGVSFPASVLRSQLALCPACLRKGYLEKMHTLRFSDVCPTHGEQYITSCPHCGNTLNWLSLKDYHCPCGFNLRKVPSEARDGSVSEIIQIALLEKNECFFKVLLASMSAVRYFHTPSSRLGLMDMCVQIATGNKSIFFREMEKLQCYFPSLHRRALVAPFIFSTEPTLSKNAIEYFYNTHQAKPRNHPTDCGCGELLFSESELAFVFSSLGQVTQLKAEKKCLKSNIKNETGQVKSIYRCPDLCKTLMHSDVLEWEPWDSPAIPEPNFNLLSCVQAAEILHTTAAKTKNLINSGLIRGLYFHNLKGFRTSVLSIKEFNDKYILRSEIAARSGMKKTELREFLKKLTPTIIKASLYAKNVIIYVRNQIPEEIISALDSRTGLLLKPAIRNESLLTFTEAADQLKLDLKDIRPLIKLGIIRTTFVSSRLGRGRDYCTGESVIQAIAWRKENLTGGEVSKLTQCSCHLIHSRFISTGFVDAATLNNTYIIKLEDAKRITDHFKAYTTLQALSFDFGCSFKAISNKMEQAGITPLKSTHPDFIKGQVTVLRSEAESNLKRHLSKNHDNFVSSERPD